MRAAWRLGCAGILATVSAGCGSTSSLSVAPSPVKCQPALTGVPGTVVATGTRVTASVTTTLDCGWTLSTDGGWIDITPVSGTGEASVSIVFARNLAPTPRSATISLDDSRVSVSQGAAAAPSPAPPGDGERVEIEGDVSRLAGSCPDVSFRVDGVTVEADAATRYRGGSCGRLENGQEVEVEGRRGQNGRIRAERIELDEDD